MALSPKTIRTQLALIKPFLGSASLWAIRRGQNRIGELMESRYRKAVITRRHVFEGFEGVWAVPKDERRDGVILYLHGGGFVCGDAEYASGCGATLAVECGVRTFAVAYRLAPENPYPAALEDALLAYKYLLDKGYTQITLCGESAGGGLCYSLSLRLRELGLPMPAGIVAISPWVDLTMSGESYDKKRTADPIMTRELISFFKSKYTDDAENPFVSPAFAELSGMPPSLIFVGSDEILLSDSEMLHERLAASGSQSRLLVAKDRWHAYLLFGLREDRRDFGQLNKFLNQVMAPERKLHWLPLDNAGKIYAAARRENWSNLFRLSATLTEDIDTELMRSALDVTVRRFPSVAVRVRRGVFWYYLESIRSLPEIRAENSYPLTKMSVREMRKCAIRVIVHKKRLAVEFFHSVADGNGGMVFLKSLLAEYIQQKYGVHVPAEMGVLGRLEEPSEAELEDSYRKHSADIAASRRENTAWHLTGTPEKDGFLNLTCMTVPVSNILEVAHRHGVSMTVFLTSVMMSALQNMQEERVRSRRHRKPIRVLVPVNLRPLFGSKSLRNFALYTTPEIIPALGKYTFPEICEIVKHTFGTEVTAKQMSMKIASNVKSESLGIVKIMPLFLKDPVMKAAFDLVGEQKFCIAFSNLGRVQLPEAMERYVERMDFILGIKAIAPYNCAALSYGDNLYINFLRAVSESDLEYHFFKVLRELGIPAKIESNAKDD